MHGHHDPALVALSILIAIAASYTALDLAGRLRAAASNRASMAWLGTAALAMGGGIWSMHFIAMLALSLPGIEITYDAALTLFSLVLAIGVTGLGFAVARNVDGGVRPLLVAGLLMGAGILTMHYTGMAAMRMPMEMHYDPVWVGISVVIAIGASIAALWLALVETRPILRFGAALAMGAAVSGMHYAGMHAAHFVPSPESEQAITGFGLDHANLAVGVAVITFVILALALAAAIVDRRLAQMAAQEAHRLRRSEEQFRALYRHTPLPLHSLSSKGIILEASDAWLQLLGQSRNDVHGERLTFFMEPDSAQKFLDHDWPLLLQGQAMDDVEYRFRTKDGVPIDVLMSSRLESDGDTLSISGGLIDVTARKRAEEALRQTQKMEAIGKLSGGIAHDFNNLLSVVLGNLELLQRRYAQDDRATALIENAMQGARRGSVLTQHMLSFARQQMLQAEPVSVPHLFQSIRSTLQRSLGPQIQFDTNFDPQGATAQVDAHQLEISIINLAVNAKDAMPDGGTVRFSATRRHLQSGNVDGLRPGAYVRLDIADDGIGMDPQTLARARDPFFTTKGLERGSGLGLSMVHGFAEQSGGALVLQSEFGTGTLATLWLPAADEEVGAADTAMPAHQEISRPLKILAVDDDFLVLMNTVDLLQELGHDVMEASSGSMALDMLEKDAAIELLVTDHAMPGMTGTELARAIRQRRPDLPILVVTGYAEIPENEQLKLPMLGKPFTHDQLRDAVTSALMKGPDPQAAATTLTSIH
ncbi:MHYT domain-containing protein [Rhizobium sp. EC-SD404]|uniref:MHYT domain-containing protein n=1 Tax=Rhizobium sp. EC-SD404 TaxID=2038389 RepID=UPI001258BEA2|nr:MHYT domain-containing protein [Rhizobium sp. EC-SD404]VVT13668.1 PAS/PAC sensor hybrid histidine kinase [Rhizobium sp. EC-SD404]